MLLNPAPARAALLVLCLSACAASEPGQTAAPAPAMNSADVLVGNQAMAIADSPTAATAFNHALAAEPGNAELLHQAFLAALLSTQPGAKGVSGQATRAQELARSIPGDPAATLVLADVDIQARHWSAAAAKFAQLPVDGPNQLLQPLLTAWAQQGAGDTDAALATLRPLLESSRFRSVAALHAAMIDDLAGRTPDAARLYRQALVDFGTLNLRLGTLVASWQARNGQPAEARGTIRAMVQSSPNLAIAEPALQQSVTSRSVASAVDGVAESYLAVAAALQQQDSFDYALILLHLAIGLRPDFTAARLLLAEMLASHGQVDGAVATLAPVPPSDPLTAVVQLREARYATEQHHDAEAEALLQHLAVAYPDQPAPLAMLGELQSDAGQFTQAAVSYGQAIQRVSQPSQADWLLFYQQGVAYDQAHDWPHAEADFLRALQLAPDQPLVLNYLGYAWTEQGRNLARARQLIERAVEQRPNDGDIVDSFGWVLLQGGDKAGAVQVLERAVELAPEDATINAHLGDAYQAAGRMREAAVQWRRALILHPGPQDTARLQAKLATATHPALPQAADRRVE